MSPTARSLAHCRKLGWIAGVVERYNMYARKSYDYLGIIDIIAITPEGKLVGIQATSGSNHSARREKALEEPRLADWLRTGATFQIWSWAKRGKQGERKLWTLREETL